MGTGGGGVAGYRPCWDGIRILTHFSLPAHPPPVAPARLDPQSELAFNDAHPSTDADTDTDAELDEPPAPQARLATSRAPP